MDIVETGIVITCFRLVTNGIAILSLADKHLAPIYRLHGPVYLG